MIILAAIPGPQRAFELAANAAAQASQNVPAYISYDATSHLQSRSMHIDRTGHRHIVRRTSDGAVVISVPGTTRSATAKSFLVQPEFDALSDFKVFGKAASNGSVTMGVTDVHPLQYNLALPPNSGVLAVAVRKYKVEYAEQPSENSPTLHLTLTPDGNDTNILPRMFFHDVYIDAKTMLPTKVVLVGPNDRQFILDYQVVDGRWLVSHFVFEETFSNLLGLVRTHGLLESAFTNFSFSNTAPTNQFSSPSLVQRCP
jgi:hypothetical protein